MCRGRGGFLCQVYLWNHDNRLLHSWTACKFRESIMQIILPIILDDSHLFRFLPTTKAAHGWNSVLSSFDSIWSVLWSSFPLPCYVCHCSRWVCCAWWFNLFFSFDLYVSSLLSLQLQLQHIRLTLVRGAGRKTGAKRSSGSLPPSYIIFVTMQWCGSTRGESAWCIHFHFQLLKAKLAVNMLPFANTVSVCHSFAFA